MITSSHTLFSIAVFSGVLRVNKNFFQGTIRDSFDMWTSLDIADFGDNQFSSSIPASIFSIPTLRILYLTNNRLDGKIPANYGAPPLLRDLYLSGNMLTGPVPAIAQGQLTLLTEFIVQSNQLTGSMPPSVCALRVLGSGILDDLWSDCSATADPRIECDLPECCTLCFP
jgi:Leucine-rich repeat (LRR) protein